MRVGLDTLRSISRGLLSHLSDPTSEDIPWVDYHGFRKFRFSDDFLRGFLSQYGVDPESVQAELILVETDLRSEVHHHEESDAFVICLTRDNAHMADPQKAFVLIDERWRPVVPAEEIEIPAGTPHGFTADTLYFLSVQSPPIVNDDRDDYVMDI